MRRSARNGEMNEQITMSPASVISFATSPTRLMFSTRSASVKPRSRLSPCRTLSPSSSIVWRPRGEQLFLDNVGDRRFPGARQPGQPQHRGQLILQRGALLPADRQRLPMDIAGPAQAEGDHSSARRFVGEAVDQDESAGVAA